MRIEHIGKSTVKVTVSGSELERLGLRYEDLGEISFPTFFSRK